MFEEASPCPAGGQWNWRQIHNRHPSVLRDSPPGSEHVQQLQLNPCFADSHLPILAWIDCCAHSNAHQVCGASRKNLPSTFTVAKFFLFRTRPRACFRVVPPGFPPPAGSIFRFLFYFSRHLSCLKIAVGSHDPRRRCDLTRALAHSSLFELLAIEISHLHREGAMQPDLPPELVCLICSETFQRVEHLKRHRLRRKRHCHLPAEKC